jgi:hypothetical protein
VAGLQWFGATPAQIDFFCFSNSFHPLYCDGGSWWDRCYGQGLACWRGALWRKTFKFFFICSSICLVNLAISHARKFDRLFSSFACCFALKKNLKDMVMGMDQ